MNSERHKNISHKDQLEKPNKNNISKDLGKLQKSQNILPKKILSVIGISFLGFIILIILAFLAQSYLRNREISEQAKAASQKVAMSRSYAEQLADKKLARIENLVKKAEIIDTPIASSKIDVCYVSHTYAGWAKSSHYQECYLRYVGGYTTKLSRDELKRRLLAQRESQTLFNRENSDQTTVFNDCELYQKSFTDTEDKGELIYRQANVTDAEYSCKVPDPIQGLFDVKGPIIQDDQLTTKIYRTYDTTKIGNASQQFWFTFIEDYYHEDLGCSAAGIFCSSPRLRPIQAP